MSCNISDLVTTPYCFLPKNSIENNECKKITNIVLYAIGSLLIVIGITLIISGACSNILGLLVAGPFVLLIGLGVTLYNWKVFCNLNLLKNKTTSYTKINPPCPQKKSLSHVSQDNLPKTSVLPRSPSTTPIPQDLATSQISLQETSSHVSQDSLSETSVLPHSPSIILVPQDLVASQISLQETSSHVSQDSLSETSVLPRSPSVILVPQDLATSQISLQETSSQEHHALQDNLAEIPTTSSQIESTTSTQTLRLSLFNQVFCNPNLLEKILNQMPDKNRDEDGVLVDMIQIIEAVNPPNTLLSVLNSLSQIQELACAVGFNATKSFKEESLLRKSEIHYIEQFALTLKKVFINVQKTPQFKEILQDISPESLNQTHFILLLKSLLNWLSVVNLIEFTKEVIKIENKQTLILFCLFMYNLFKVKPTLKKHKFYYYGYGMDIKTNCIGLIKEKEENITIIKHLLKDALKKEEPFPVILFLVRLFNELICYTVNPEKHFTSPEKLEILLIAEQSNSPEKEHIQKLLLKSLQPSLER